MFPAFLFHQQYPSSTSKDRSHAAQTAVEEEEEAVRLPFLFLALQKPLVREEHFPFLCELKNMHGVQLDFLGPPWPLVRDGVCGFWDQVGKCLDILEWSLGHKMT